MDDFKDPSQMTDEELDAAIEGKVTEDPKEPPKDPDPKAPEQDPPADPKPEDPKEDPKEDPQDPPQDPPADPPVEDPKPSEDPKEQKTPSPRRDKRIQALIAKMKRTTQQPAPAPAQPSTPPAEVKPIDFRALIDAPDEVYATLERAAEEYGKSLQTAQPAPQQQQNQSIGNPTDTLRWEMGVKIDTPQVLAKYEQLNPESPKFDAVVADALNMEYLHTVGFDEKTGLVANPNISYAEYVEARFELANLLAQERVQTTTKEIAKQAASTGLRPDGSQSKKLNLNQAPENMTDEELDAIIGQSIPSR